MDAFRSADEVLLSGVQGITNLITTPGLINLDFADVKSVMSGAGSALMGIGSSRGDGRAVEAAQKAINSPLLEASMDGAQGVLLSIAGGSDLGLFEINEAASLVQESAHPEANIIFGTIIDDSLGDEVRVTVIAAGFDAGAPTHKKLDPPAVSSSAPSAGTAAASGSVSGPATTASAEAGAIGGSRSSGARQEERSQSRQQPATGGDSSRAAAQHGGSLPQSQQGAHPAAGNGTRGSLPNRAVPVTEEDADSDDDVDVPPFMRR
jgi:cell division protein FtsZ